MSAGVVDLDRVAERFGLSPLPQPVPLGGGYHNVLLRAGDVVLRIEEREPESVAWEHELLSFLAAEIPQVLAPLRAPDGATFVVDADGRVVSLLPFVDAERGGDGGAELLAAIHRRGLAWRGGPRPGRPSYRELDLDRNDWWDLSRIEPPPELRRALARVRAWLAEPPPLVETTVHGDLARQNVLSRGGRIVAVLDWEYARLDWALLDLANGAWALAEHDVDGFVAAYRDAGGPGEPEWVVDGIRVRHVANALYSLTRAAEGRAWSPDWVDYVLARLREME